MLLCALFALLALLACSERYGIGRERVPHNVCDDTLFPCTFCDYGETLIWLSIRTRGIVRIVVIFDIWQ